MPQHYSIIRCEINMFAKTKNVIKLTLELTQGLACFS